MFIPVSMVVIPILPQTSHFHASNFPFFLHYSAEDSFLGFCFYSYASVSVLNGDQSIFKFLVMINHPKTYVTLPHSETFLGSVWEGHSQSTKSPRQNSRCLVKGQVEACIWATLRNKAKRNPMTIIGK